MEIKITDIEKTTIKGVTVLNKNPNNYEEAHFQWIESPLVATMTSNEISGGVLNCKEATPIFKELEYHEGKEMFYFVEGTAVIPFADFDNAGNMDADSVQMVRIPKGTQIIIDANKLHFPPVAVGGKDVQIIVVSPKMDAPRLKLETEIKGI